MRLFFPKQAHHRTKKMILVHVRLYVLLVVFYFDACNGVKISDQSQAHIETLIGMWLKNPCLFPNRISGTSIFCVGEPSAEDSGYYVPDILLWDPHSKIERVKFALLKVKYYSLSQGNPFRSRNYPNWWVISTRNG